MSRFVLVQVAPSIENADECKHGRRRRAVFYGVIALALIKPDSLPYIGLGWLETILVSVDIAVLVCLVGAFILGKFRLSSITVAVTLYFCTLTLSTWLGTQDFGLLVRSAGPAVAACMLTDYAISRHPRSFLDGMTWGLLLVYVANFISILMFYPGGMYSTQLMVGGNYLMGFDNGITYGLLPMTVFAVLRSLVRTGRLLTPMSVGALVLTCTSVIYVTAASGIVAIATFILILIVANSGRLGHGVLLTLFLGWLTSAILIVVTRHQDLIPANFTALFGKDATLTGRTVMWDYALEQVANHPFLGVGVGTWVLGPNGAYHHPHSMLLDAVFKGGLIGGLAIAIVVLVVIRAGVAGPPSWAHTVIVSGTLALLVAEIANSAQYKALFWVVLTLLAHSARLAGLVPNSSNGLHSRNSDPAVTYRRSVSKRSRPTA